MEKRRAEMSSVRVPRNDPASRRLRLGDEPARASRIGDALAHLRQDGPDHDASELTTIIAAWRALIVAERAAYAAVVAERSTLIDRTETLEAHNANLDLRNEKLETANARLEAINAEIRRALFGRKSEGGWRQTRTGRAQQHPFCSGRRNQRCGAAAASRPARR